MKIIKLTLVVLIIVCLTTPILSACSNQDFDNSLPSLDASDGWHRTLYTDFAEYDTLEKLYNQTPWSPSPHGLRKTEYWCDQAISIDGEKGALVISSTVEDGHVCDVCSVSSGVFTGGIETRATDDNEGFEQAFGYFEAVVKVPNAPGMWSAFWLQSSGTTKIGNQGKDGTEIDVYESSFHQKNRTCTGNALHYDAYDTIWYRCVDNVTDVGYDLYDGQYHKYALLWTPDYYVFYVDDFPVWTTDAGGVSRVEEFLRLTVEIRDTTYGPYGQKIGSFENRTDGSTDFCIKSVAVWQKDDYVPHIKSPDQFRDLEKTYSVVIMVGIISAVVLIVAAVVVVVARRKYRR